MSSINAWMLRKWAMNVYIRTFMRHGLNVIAHLNSVPIGLNELLKKLFTIPTSIELCEWDFFEVKCNEKCFIIKVTLEHTWFVYLYLRFNIVDSDWLDVLERWKNMQNRWVLCLVWQHIHCKFQDSCLTMIF